MYIANVTDPCHRTVAAAVVVVDKVVSEYP